MKPAWSPDGSTIVFDGYSAEYPYQNLWTVHPDGTGLSALDLPLGTASNPEGYADPTWSPDGSTIIVGHGQHQGSPSKRSASPRSTATEPDSAGCRTDPVMNTGRTGASAHADPTPRLDHRHVVGHIPPGEGGQAARTTDSASNRPGRVSWQRRPDPGIELTGDHVDASRPALNHARGRARSASRYSSARRRSGGGQSPLSNAPRWTRASATPSQSVGLGSQGTRLHFSSLEPRLCQGEGRGFESRRPLQGKSWSEALFGGSLAVSGPPVYSLGLLRARFAARSASPRGASPS